MKLSTGCDPFDSLIGGYERGILTTIFGPSAAGKTTACLLPMGKISKKIIFMDTEGGLSVERLNQICPHYKDVLQRTIVIKPNTFEEQDKGIKQLKSIMSDKIDLVVVDTISMLYRLVRGQQENVVLSQQIAMLTEIARTWNIPVILTNQVYSDFSEKDKVKMIGGDILKYGSKCLIELEILDKGNRRAHLIKHRSLPYKKIDFLIGMDGFQAIPEHEESRK